ncbi:6-pyruvoyltetrahydropterin/6-carboxytetrahydropterin synthase [Sinosporangium album]|uniref:6-carboxy-5,6,7,8-tetrahydropterin synthase n=1 Tax=Sinosporangium album TaxID=504805 RepID=A0A1G8EJW0_9ACTN|nr:6-carboxytetrahydropterin synthase [Sinosporangium album]SDH70019.1 6-pyruvoyltetrahydropterin/6-carboxytetrahydropterin synthase [Sinosporangium album]
MYQAHLTHTFHAAHRLPHLGGKCANLHGHTWTTTVTITTPQLTEDGTIIEFGAFKTRMRTWIDNNLDHAALLGTDDPLTPSLREQGCRVAEFGRAPYGPHPWPTVEAVAELIAYHAQTWLAQAENHADEHGTWYSDTPTRCRITQVTVQETPTNTATWTES